MSLVIGDRVMETASTTGTGAFTLAGAYTGYRAFSAVCATGDLVYYCIEAIDGNGNPSGDWEVGLGTYSGANTLTRTTVAASSNAGAAVNFAAGTKRVTLAASAGFLSRLLSPEVKTDSTTNYDLLAADRGKYIRLTNAAAKTVTVRANATHALDANSEWHFRNAGAGDATMTPAGGVTINAPAGGTLLVPEGGTVTLKWIATNTFDLIGYTT